MEDAQWREYHDLGDLDGARVTVVIHHSGRRDLYLRTLDDDEPVARLTFNEEQARQVAEALTGEVEATRVTRSA
jgi:K+/H+ antiporter YhaU regulatory subunit KhtT